MSAITNKKLFKLLSLTTVSLLTLTSCGDKNNDLPVDYKDNIITINGNEITLEDIYFNDKEQYYDNLSGFNEKAEERLLLEVAKSEVGDGKTLTGYTALTAEELQEKAEEVMINKVNTNTYDVNYIFDEEAFVMSLKAEMQPIDSSTCDFSKEVIVTKNSTFDEIFTCDYKAYMEKEIYPDVIRNQLVTEYLYEESYTSIGTTNARDFDIVKLVDGTNQYVGTALKFINAFLDDLQSETITDKSYLTLETLSLAYKGNSDDANAKKFLDSHAELKDLTQLAFVEKDMEKIATKDDEGHFTPLPDNKIDKDLFDSYTSNMMYSIDVGYDRKLKSITQEQIFESGMYLSSSTPALTTDAIKTRIFSSNYNTTENVTTKDVTTNIGGLRFLTTENGQGSTSEDRNVIFYDAASSTYYLVVINEVVNTGVLAKNDSDSDEVKAQKKALVKEVSYKMVDSSTYRTDATVHFLKDLDISYNNETFFEYMKTTYPALFEESTYED